MHLRHSISKVAKLLIPKKAPAPQKPQRLGSLECNLLLVGFDVTYCEAYRLVHGMCICSYDKTMDDPWRKIFTLDGEKIVVEYHWTNQILKETKELSAFSRMMYGQINALVLFFCVGCRRSFEQLAEHRSSTVEMIRNLTGKDTLPVVLMSTVGGSCEDAKRRVVTQEECEGLASQIGCQYFESTPGGDWDSGFYHLIRRLNELNELKRFTCY